MFGGVRERPTCLAAAVWKCPAIHSERAKTGAKTASFSPVSHTLIHTHTGKVASNTHVDTTVSH